MIYRRVVNGDIDGTFYGTGGARVGIAFVPANKLHLYSIYPQIEPNYDPTKETVSDLFFDTDINIVTRKVYDFEKGRAHNWKFTKFVNDELYRKIKLRVRRIDTLTGGSLEQMSNDLVKSEAPFYLTDSEGNRQENGSYTEVYLLEIEPSDLPAIQAYVAATPGAVLQYYDDLT